MMMVRGCKKEEFTQALDLINRVFRISDGLAPTMGQEFLLLLSENNLDHMRVIVEDGKVVSDINFYETKIILGGCSIGVASIGAVCCDPDYRGRGYASKILDDVEEHIENDGINIMLVSGSRNLYLRRGCTISGICYQFEIKDGFNIESGVDVVPLDDKNLSDAVKIYSLEPCRFYRTRKEFELLFKGATYNWGKYIHKKYLIKMNDEALAYIILKTYNDEGEYKADVAEFGGDRDIVLAGIAKIMQQENLAHINIPCLFNDSMVSKLKNMGISYEMISLLGTVKILNFEKFMNELKPYFYQFIDRDIVDKVRFVEQDGKYFIELHDEVLEIQDIQTLTRLVFGHIEAIDVDFTKCPEIARFVNAVFPIPFVWPGNMNFQ